MKSLEIGSDPAVQAEGTCGRQVLEVVPLIMRMIRADLRNNRACDLSVPQFRALHYVGGATTASLSELAAHLGLSLPSMSKQVDVLLARGLLSRTEDPVDRRRVVLRLTAEGEARVQAALTATAAALTERLQGLSAEQQVTVGEAMAALRTIFASEN